MSYNENEIEENEIKKYSTEFFVKKIKNFFSLFLSNFLIAVISAAILTGLTLGILIICVGFSSFIKIAFIIITGVISFICILQHIESEYFKMLCTISSIYILLSVLCIEGCLYYNSTYEEIIPIKIIVLEKNFPVLNKSGKIVPNITIPYKVVTLYNNNDDDIIYSKIIEEEDEKLLPFLLSIKQQRIFIKYKPFLTYSKEKIYETQEGLTNDTIN